MDVFQAAANIIQAVFAVAIFVKTPGNGNGGNGYQKGKCGKKW